MVTSGPDKEEPSKVLTDPNLNWSAANTRNKKAYGNFEDEEKCGPVLIDTIKYKSLQVASEKIFGIRFEKDFSTRKRLNLILNGKRIKNTDKNIFFKDTGETFVCTGDILEMVTDLECEGKIIAVLKFVNSRGM